MKFVPIVIKSITKLSLLFMNCKKGPILKTLDFFMNTYILKSSMCIDAKHTG